MTDVEEYASRFINHWESASTQRKYRALWDAWRLSLGKKSPLNVTDYDARRWVKLLRARTGWEGKALADSTVFNYVSILKAFYDRYRDWEIINTNPFRKISFDVPQGSPGTIRPTARIECVDIKRMMDAPGIVRPADIRDAAVIAIMFGGALRVGELPQLKMSDLRRTSKGNLAIWLTKTKAHKSKLQAITKDCWPYVERFARQRLKENAKPDSPLFVHYRGTYPTPRPVNIEKLKRIFGKWKTHCRIPGRVSSHSLRAMAITRLLENGADYRAVQEFSRHSSVAMVERYDKRRFDIDDNVAYSLVDSL